MQENGEQEEELLFPNLEEETDENSSLNLDDDEQPDKKDSLKKEVEEFTLQEEGETEVNTEESDDNTSSPEGNISSPSVVSSLALALREKGVLTTIDEDKLKTFKDAEELIDALINDRIESSKKEFNETQWKYIDALRSGIPEEEIKGDLAAEEAYNSLKPEDLETNVNLQQQVYFNDLMSQGISEEKAKKIIANAVSTGTIVEDSKESLVSLQTKSKQILLEKTNQAKEKAKADAEVEKTKVAKLKDDVLKTDEFAGIKLNDVMKNKIFENMTKVVETEGNKVYNTITADRKKNAEDFEKRQAIFYTLTNGFKDFTNIQQKVTTSKVNELKEVLAKEGYKTGKGHNVPLSTGAEDFIKELKKAKL